MRPSNRAPEQLRDTREAVADYLKAYPDLATRLGIQDVSSVDDELLNLLEGLGAALFGEPALSEGW